MYFQSTGMNMKRGGKLAWFFLFLSFHPSSAQQKIEKLGPAINSDRYDEISPVVGRNGKTLYFTRTGRPDFNRTLIQEEVDLSKVLPENEYFVTLKDVYSQIAEKEIDFPVSSVFNQDVWIAESREGLFDHVYQPGFPLNNALPNSVCSLSPDDNTLVIINHFGRDGSMYKGFSIIDRRPDGSFNFPEPIYVHDFYSRSPEVNLCMSWDGDVLLLSLNRQDSYGDNDLYVCFKLKQNLWSEPINLGPVINSSSREMTPFITKDKTRLFFASNRPGGPGGTDIYVSRRLDFSWTRWGEPELIGAPVNSSSDDSNPILMDSSNLYFTSRRDGTSDIFRADFIQEESEDLYEAPEISTAIILKGSIRNSLTGDLISAGLSFGPSRHKKQMQTIQSEDGLFEISLKKLDQYRLTPHKEGYLGKSQLVDVPVLHQSANRVYEIDFYLSPLEGEQKLDIRNLYFERGTAVVLPQSYPALDSLAGFLNQNPSVQIRIEGHTDSVGKYYELLDLSRSRASTIKKYLIDRGIVSARIDALGYGSTRPVTLNHTEESRARNRRVEIFITHSGSPSLLYKNLPDPVVRYSRDLPVDHSSPSEQGMNRPAKTNNQNKAAVVDPVPPDPNLPFSDKPVSNDSLYRNESTSSDENNASGLLPFLPHELALDKSAFPALQKLLDFLKNHPSKKIHLMGFCAAGEQVEKPSVFALQRAQGIKEYLIFKSIEPGRISISPSGENPSGISGVRVFLQD